MKRPPLIYFNPKASGAFPRAAAGGDFPFSGDVSVSPHRSRAVVGGGGGDPNFASTVLLLGFEGANGATSGAAFTDESFANHGAATLVAGNAQISTAQFKFGSSSLLLDGVGDSIHFADRADWHFGSSPFTVEGFIRPAEVSGTRFLVGQWQGFGNLSWILYLNGTSLAWNTSTTGMDNNADITSSGVTLALNTQYHIVLSFNGSKYRMFIDGVMRGSFTTVRTLFISTNRLSIGSNALNDNFHYSGHIDELRINKGVGLYNSDASFTPPTAAFPRS